MGDGVAAGTGGSPSRLETASRAAAILCGAIGACGLTGWAFSVPALTSVLPGAVSMKINTAVGLLILAGAIECARGVPRSGARRVLAGAFAASLLALGLVSVAQYLFAVDMFLDEALVRDPTVAASEWPGRMAPVTAGCFVLLALSLLAFRVRAAWGASAVRTTAFAAHALACMGIVGYAFGVESLRRVFPFCSIAIHTAVAFWAASLAILLTMPAVSFLRGALEGTPSAVVARRWLVAVPVALVLVGLAGVAGVRAGAFDDRFALAAMTLAGAALAALLAVRSAAVASGLEEQRQGAEAAVRVLTETLERRVRERTTELEGRTRELEETLAQVRTLSGLLPICAWCKRIRDDGDYWHTVEDYVATHTDARFTHGMCPECYAKLKAD